MLKGEFDGLVVPTMSSILGFVVVLMMIGQAVEVFVGIDVGPALGSYTRTEVGVLVEEINVGGTKGWLVIIGLADGSREVFAWTVVCSVPGGSLGW